ECSASYESRRGRMFLTFSHLYFDGGSAAFLSPLQKVIPLYTVSSVAKGFGQNASAGLSALLAQQGLVITDLGNTEHMMYVHGNAPDFLDRVVDVVSQV